MFIIKVGGGLPRFADALVVLIQDADAAVLTYPVAHLQRIYPHRQLAREDLMQHCGAQTTELARLPDDLVHLAVYPDAAVARALERLLREPVVAVTPDENLDQLIAELGQLSL